MSNPSVFISYASEDQNWIGQLLAHLQILTHQYHFPIHHKALIGAGEKIEETTRNYIQQSAAAILFISADYLASEDIRSIEIPALTEKQASEGTIRFFPVLVSQCSYRSYEQLTGIQMRNSGIPLLSMTSEQVNSFFSALTQDVLKYLQSEVALPPKQKGVSELINNSLSYVTILLVLAQKEPTSYGFSMSQICVQSKMTSSTERAIVAPAVYNLKDLGLVQRKRIEKLTYWELTPEGVKWARKVEDAVRASLNFN